jgi:NADH dehydrogenase
MNKPAAAPPHRVLIIGGGFGGLEAARRLRRAAVAVTLVDRRNFHLFQPLLYQVATGALSPANIAAPLRAILRPQANVEVLLGEVDDIDVPARRARLRGSDLVYDTLIVAAGATHSYFGHPEWEADAPGLKTIEDATALRRRILLAFETAERLGDAGEIVPWMTFVIVGAGPTGVEMAGAVAELAHETLRRDFRGIDPTRTRILLVEGTDRVLPPFAPRLSTRARADLEAMGVEVRLKTLVTGIESGAVTLKSDDRIERIAAHTVLWSAGVEASPLAKRLAEATGSELDRGGRVRVGADLTLPGHPEIFAIGDLALFIGPDGKPLPGVAPVAIQQGRYAAHLIAARLAGKTLPDFRYHDRGMMATVGRMKAVANLYGYQFGGPLAWFVWLFIHLMQIVQFDSRIMVFVQWAWHYTTRNRSARLITGTAHETAPPTPGAAPPRHDAAGESAPSAADPSAGKSASGT